MKKQVLPEVWLRGPLPGIPALLQPVAHALLQAREEVTALMEDFPGEKLWERPAGLASAGFHLQHLAGVLDRLLTYARGASLDELQLKALSAEGKADPDPDNATVRALVDGFCLQVDRALEQLSETPESILKEARGVGRAKIPSTVIGLLTHAAEHTQRHNGQLLVTATIVRAQATP